MSILLGDLHIDAAALETVIGTVARRADLCVKVLDQEGVIRAVNPRGLDLLQVQKDEFCGNVWTDLWDGESQQRAIQAVQQGFSGVANSFTGTFQTGDGVVPVVGNRSCAPRVARRRQAVTARDLVRCHIASLHNGCFA